MFGLPAWSSPLPIDVLKAPSSPAATVSVKAQTVEVPTWLIA